jgi:hypothetical protein
MIDNVPQKCTMFHPLDYVIKHNSIHKQMDQIIQLEETIQQVLLIEALIS